MSAAGVGRTLSLFNILDDSLDLFLDLQHDDAVLSVGISADCRLIASGAADQLIRVTDSKTRGDTDVIKRFKMTHSSRCLM